MYKNVSGQFIFIFARDIISDAPKTGDAANITVNITGDNGALGASVNSVSELDDTNAKGVYKLALTQGETNADMIVFSGLSTTAGIEIIPLFVQTQISISAIADAVWDEALTGASHNTSTSAGKRLRTIASAVIYNENLPAQSDINNNNQIKLDSGASSTNGAYDPAIVVIVSGTGIGQTRLILEYNGDSRVATVDRNWKTNPAENDEFIIYADAGRQHVNEGLAQAGSTNTITLNSLGSSQDNAYINQRVFLRSGTGEDQVRRVIDYNGTSKIAIVSKNWDINPDNTTGYVMLPMEHTSNGTLQITTIKTLASQTSFTLNAGSADNNAYNDCIIIIENAATDAQKAVGLVLDYIGSSKTIILDSDPGIFTIASGNTVRIIAAPINIADIKKLIRADKVIDATEDPWVVDYKEEGTEIVLMSKTMKTPSNVNITNVDNTLGKLEQE